jgi:hypothetical protein
MDASYIIQSLLSQAQKNFLLHVNTHPNTPIEEPFQPYNDHGAVAREIFD